MFPRFVRQSCIFSHSSSAPHSFIPGHWSSKNDSRCNSWLSARLLQFSSCRHIRIKSCSTSDGSEHPCSSCCTKVSVLPHHASSGRPALATCSPSNRFQNCHNCFHQQPSYLAQIIPRYTPSRSLRSSSSITISGSFYEFSEICCPVHLYTLKKSKICNFE